MVLEYIVAQNRDLWQGAPSQARRPDLNLSVGMIHERREPLERAIDGVEVDTNGTGQLLRRRLSAVREQRLDQLRVRLVHVRRRPKDLIVLFGLDSGQPVFKNLPPPTRPSHLEVVVVNEHLAVRTSRNARPVENVQ